MFHPSSTVSTHSGFSLKVMQGIASDQNLDARQDQSHLFSIGVGDIDRSAMPDAFQ